jgi:periplasmic protein TonB
MSAAGVAVRDGGKGATANSGSSSPTGSKEGQAAAASKQGRGEGAQRTNGTGTPQRGAYQQQLKSLIESHKKYPLAARRSRQEGSCVRRFSLGRDGTLRSVESVTSCGHPFLDGAATSAVTSVRIFPPLPDEFGAEESFSVTIIFTLAGK